MNFKIKQPQKENNQSFKFCKNLFLFFSLFAFALQNGEASALDCSPSLLLGTEGHVAVFAYLKVIKRKFKEAPYFLEKGDDESFDFYARAVLEMDRDFSYWQNNIKPWSSKKLKATLEKEGFLAVLEFPEGKIDIVKIITEHRYLYQKIFYLTFLMNQSGEYRKKVISELNQFKKLEGMGYLLLSKFTERIAQKMNLELFEVFPSNFKDASQVTQGSKEIDQSYQNFSFAPDVDELRIFLSRQIREKREESLTVLDKMRSIDWSGTNGEDSVSREKYQKSFNESAFYAKQRNKIAKEIETIESYILKLKE